MKRTLGLAALALSATLMTGCTEVGSLNEFVTADESVMDKALLGVWTSDDSTFAIQADGNAYIIRYFDKGPSAARFHARMIRVGDVKLLDVVQEADDAFMLPLHFLVRVWSEGNTLYWAFTDSGWMKEEAGRRLATRKFDKRHIITAPGTEWRKTALLLAADDRAYSGKRESLAKVQ